jgi:hypothetical protein
MAPDDLSRTLAVRFADEWGRAWRVALDPADDDVLTFATDEGTTRRLYDFPADWHERTTFELRELLAHTALTRDSLP